TFTIVQVSLPSTMPVQTARGCADSRSTLFQNSLRSNKPESNQRTLQDSGSDASAGEEEYQEDEQQNAQAAAWIVASSGAVRPRGHGEDHQRDKERHQQAHCTPPLRR